MWLSYNRYFLSKIFNGYFRFCVSDGAAFEDYSEADLENILDAAQK